MYSIYTLHQVYNFFKKGEINIAVIMVRNKPIIARLAVHLNLKFKLMSNITGKYSNL